MARAFSYGWTRFAAVLVAVYGLFGAGSAWAAKPTIAILGIEVIDPTGAVDATTTSAARDLTEGLRARAKVGSGPYQLAAGSDKELIDEKLLKGCENEALSCMTQIGKDLGADFLMYGKLEKKADGYHVTINVLSISKKKFEKSKSAKLPLGRDARAVADDARKLYNDLTGAVDAGSIVITTNVQEGKVFVDDQERGSLTAGSLTIDGLPEGRYRVAVESQGRGREEVVVTVRSGESTAQSITLVDGKHEVGGTVSDDGVNVWKPIFIGSVVAGAALGGVAVWAWRKEVGHESQIKADLAAAGISAGGGPGDLCKDNFKQASAALRDACSKRKIELAAGISGGVLAGVAVISGVMWYMRGESDERPTQTGMGKKRRSQFAITPIVSPDGGGATIQLDW